MGKDIFHPFEDRLSRDIRNRLSSSFIESIEKGAGKSMGKVTCPFLKSNPNSAYSEYIENRLVKYAKATSILESGPEILLWRGFVLWDLELFFEVHEILEHAWYTATGGERSVLQAIIRAAGVYIKLEYGYITHAQKMAAKAVDVFQQEKALLQPYCNIELLIRALNEMSPTPPKILKLQPEFNSKGSS
jgi:uncharacterized protein